MRNLITLAESLTEWPSRKMMDELKAQSTKVDAWDASRLLFQYGVQPGPGPEMPAFASFVGQPYDESELMIKEIKAHSSSRKAGGGTMVLKLVCELANKYGVTLHLHAKAIRTMVDRGGMNDAQLEEWYGKYGFETQKGIPDGGGVNMTRKPSQTLDESRIAIPEFDHRKAIKNPGTDRIMRMVKKAEYHELRGLYDGSDLYFWDAALGIHAHVAPQIGIEYKAERRLTVEVSYGEVEMCWDGGVPENLIVDHYGAAGELTYNDSFKFNETIEED